MVLVQNTVECGVAAGCVRLLTIVLEDNLHAAADSHLWLVLLLQPLPQRHVRAPMRELCQLLLDAVEHRH